MRRAALLQAQPRSAGRARRLVAEALEAARLPRLTDAATLLVSELVTNAVVHARTSIDVRVQVNGHRLLVEVADLSPQLPSPRHYDETATTGRGLELVELLSRECGVRHTTHGKVAWFSLVDEPEAAVEPEPPAARDVAAALDVPPAPGVTTAADVLTVELNGLPVALYCIFQEHADALLREYLLAALYQEAAPDDGGPDRPPRPASLPAAYAPDPARAHEALAHLAAGCASAFELRLRAVAIAQMDARLHLPPDAVPAFAVLRAALDTASRRSAAGELLAPPAQPELVRLRDWCCDQVAGQAVGAEPVAWAGTRLEDDPPREPADWDTAAVEGAATAVLAADDANRIIAVSAPAAALLGWPVEELVGRRLVTIVPERLREAHVAGFVRYLLRREPVILGRPVALPALRRDGGETAVRLLLTAHATPRGRTVFVGELTPVDDRANDAAGHVEPVVGADPTVDPDDVTHRGAGRGGPRAAGR